MYRIPFATRLETNDRLYLQRFGFSHYEQILSGLVSTFPVILDTIFKYWIFRYLNRVSPSHVVIYHAIND